MNCFFAILVMNKYYVLQVSRNEFPNVLISEIFLHLDVMLSDIRVKSTSDACLHSMATRRNIDSIWSENETKEFSIFIEHFPECNQEQQLQTFCKLIKFPAIRMKFRRKACSWVLRCSVHLGWYRHQCLSIWKT